MEESDYEPVLDKDCNNTIVKQLDHDEYGYGRCHSGGRGGRDYRRAHSRDYIDSREYGGDSREYMADCEDQAQYPLTQPTCNHYANNYRASSGAWQDLPICNTFKPNPGTGDDHRSVCGVSMTQPPPLQKSILTRSAPDLSELSDCLFYTYATPHPQHPNNTRRPITLNMMSNHSMPRQHITSPTSRSRAVSRTATLPNIQHGSHRTLQALRSRSNSRANVRA